MSKKIPEGWKKVKLGEIITLQRGYDLPRRKMKKGNIAVAGSNGIIGYHNKATTKAPGITIGRSGNLGNAFLYKTDFWAHNTTLFVKDFKGNNVIFIYYLLKNINFKQFNVGSAVPTLNRNHIHPLEVKIPIKLEEQKAIASVLSSLDDKIDLLHRQNKTLEQMAETLFRKWFVEDEKEDWEIKRLDNYFELLGGYPFKSKSFIESGRYKIITIKNVQNGFLDDIKTSFVNKLPEKLKGYQMLTIGDIIMSLTGNVGRICVVDINNALLNQRVAKIVTKNKKWKPFSYFYFKQKNMLEKLELLSKGSAQLNLSPIETLKQIDIFPPDEIIDTLNNYLEPIFAKILKNKQQIRTLENLRDTLLPKLMRGEVRVKY